MWYYCMFIFIISQKNFIYMGMKTILFTVRKEASHLFHVSHCKRPLINHSVRRNPRDIKWNRFLRGYIALKIFYLRIHLHIENAAHELYTCSALCYVLLWLRIAQFNHTFHRHFEWHRGNIMIMIKIPTCSSIFAVIWNNQQSILVVRSSK